MPIQYFATNRKQGDGTTTVWSFSFAGARPDANNGTEAYLESEDVRVALVAIEDDGEEIRTPINFVLGPGPAQVTVSPAVANGQDFVIYRETESESPVADFTDFASISEQDLDSGFRQTLFVVQEAVDRVQDTNANSIGAIGTANSALGTANAAVATAGSAISTANTASSTATQAQGAASQAVLTANTAASQAATALSTANTAQDGANQAQAAVASAVSTASAAQAAANAANNTATTANNTANEANATAGTALSTANSAASTANAAASQAATALSTANGAASVAVSAESTADQALQAAALVVNFQEQLNRVEAAIEDLTGADVNTLTRNEDNLEFLTDFAIARTNLSVYSKAEVDATQQAQDTTLSSQGSRITAVENELPNKALRTTSITAGTGLIGGGDLTQNRTISLPTPTTLSGATTNSATSAGHTHNIDSTRTRTTNSASTLLAAGAMLDHVQSTDHDTRYYTKTEVDNFLSVNPRNNYLVDGRFTSWESTLYSGIGYGGSTMWRQNYNNATLTQSRLLLPVVGAQTTQSKEAVALLWGSRTAADGFAVYTQRVDNLIAFGGRKLVVSGWIRAQGSGRTVGLEITGSFGSGGSAELNGATNASVKAPITATTSWQFFTSVVELPSLSDRTFGVGSHLGVNFWLSGGSVYSSRISGATAAAGGVEFTGLKLEIGDKATYSEPEDEAALQARIQRYFERVYFEHRSDSVDGDIFTLVNYRVPKRTLPNISFVTTALVNVTNVELRTASDSEKVNIGYKANTAPYHVAMTIKADARL